jgi:hypothetical protein
MTIDRRALRNDLVKQFNEEELKTLAFDLGMDCISGSDRNSLARELNRQGASRPPEARSACTARRHAAQTWRAA